MTREGGDEDPGSKERHSLVARVAAHLGFAVPPNLGKFMQAFPDSLLPRLLCLCLVEFASRMPEVKDPFRRDLMADALFEIRRNLARMASAAELPEERPANDDGEESLRATIVLLEEGSIPMTAANREAFRNVRICIDHMFEGVEVGDEPPVSQCRLRRAG